jgi:dihydroorotate dehydrogenase electron transfer subunit
MSRVLSNLQLSRDFFLMRVAEPNEAKMGQFYMLRSWGMYPLLSRPLSVYDADPETLTFLYKVVGQGTKLFSGLRAGDSVATGRALGNTFPVVTGRVALVGGGVGIAPLYLTAKTLKKMDASTRLDLYLGFSDEAVLCGEFEKVGDRVVTDVGGFITDRISPEDYDWVLTCGPEAMMRALYGKCEKAGTKLYVSMERRMACGFGVCLACGCDTSRGRKKVCVDGPVFPAEEVFI